MTNYFYDCEFKENGKTIDLISIGMVSSDGREFYAVSNEFDTYAVSCTPWLMNNVMTSIGYDVYQKPQARNDPNKIGFTITDPAAMSRADIAAGIKGFVTGTQPQFWAWFGAYDHVCLSQLWGKMLDIPSGMPMSTNDIKTLQFLSMVRNHPQQEGGNHNALADARHNKVLFDYYWSLLTR